jgi:hypothetical protein
MRRDAGALQAASSSCMVVVCSSSIHTRAVMHGCVSYAASERMYALASVRVYTERRRGTRGHALILHQLKEN